SIKLSALDSQFDAIDPAGAVAVAGGRLRELLRIARRQRAFINVDMESYAVKDLTLHVFKTVLDEPEFRDVTDVGIVVQAYLLDSEADLIELRDWAARRGTPVWVRLVKGAYWDYETTHARATGWPVPVFERKWETDANFERLTQMLLASHHHLRPAIGSHNLRSIAHAIAAAEQCDLPPDALELQMLYGMADAEKETLAELGYRLRVYMPYGELIPGMAYLVRRLLENTSNDSFVRQEHSESAAPERLLRRPQPEPKPSAPEPSSLADSASHMSVHTPSSAEFPMSRTATSTAKSNAASTAPPESLRATFRNQPPVDFSREINRTAMSEALDRVLMRLGKTYPLVIGGESVPTGVTRDSIDPSHRQRVVGTVHQAGAIEVDAAVQAAASAQAAWRDLGAAGRAEYLREAAQRMRERLFDLAALEVYECAKGWREATNDICEAIDFCEFYADRAIHLEQPRGADVPGEENRFVYQPIGVAAVIAPWNFPLAILTGMTTAALATGNTVVMKPAEQSSVIAAQLMNLFHEIGLPPGVLNYLPGAGETAGAALVDHPQVGLIAFTGSRDVGLAINRRAAEVSASGRFPFVKRVIAEMGGKNAIIVDGDADLDEAVLGIVKSAFGYQGQKCSASSRVIVVDEVHDQFVERLKQAAASLKVGPPEDPSASVGPVIDHAAMKKVLDYIELGRREAREVLAVDVGALAGQGWFVGPHIFTDVAADSRLAQEEIFGPVLAVIRADDLDEAIRYANGTMFALTAGMFSRSPANLERARRELIAGNLYLNRGITGALVGRQPFGGFKMSGIGSKAGGDDYLLQYVVPRTITENTMRRGFAPD
ncbi:MAG: bifunctional proline dehydrogenase/L-glutamate gamma-semialdehyde dehydrogenase, partial [Planctomycetales bacterium]|nr:bifunctional proline dehydrogenase/L-glutamate gamma-semialdehyde dehydrogenase [Planctomycetales bacterium]